MEETTKPDLSVDYFCPYEGYSHRFKAWFGLNRAESLITTIDGGSYRKHDSIEKLSESPCQEKLDLLINFLNENKTSELGDDRSAYDVLDTMEVRFGSMSLYYENFFWIQDKEYTNPKLETLAELLGQLLLLYNR